MQKRRYKGPQPKMVSGFVPIPCTYVAPCAFARIYSLRPYISLIHVFTYPFTTLDHLRRTRRCSQVVRISPSAPASETR